MEFEEHEERERRVEGGIVDEIRKTAANNRK